MDERLKVALEVKEAQRSTRPALMGTHGMVTANHYLAALAGFRMLLQGGNAIDAAVAAGLAEGVVDPHMGTLGGEVPLLIYVARERRVVAINGNMTAPRAATIEEFRRRGLEKIPGGGLLAAGVPGALDAWITALDRYGTMSLAQVMAPALELAEEGFPLHPGLVEMPVFGIWASAERFRSSWSTSAQLYLPEGEVPQAGQVLCNPDLAQTFRQLLAAEASALPQGRSPALAKARDLFYRGEIARAIVAFSQREGGLLSLEDLAAFRAKIEEPLTVSYRGYDVYKVGPWSQGPVFLQQLRLLEGFDLRSLGHNRPAYIHLLVEVAKLAFADREAYYADPEFASVPLEPLLSQRYAEVRRGLLEMDRASWELRPGDPEKYGPLKPLPWTPEARASGPGTVHVDAADRAGNLVAATPSGAWLAHSPVVEGLGFPLGTRLQTFYLDPDHPNALQPGKRPRTTLSPSLVLKGGQPFLAFGTAGGDKQDQWTLQFFLNVVDFGMEIQEAIEAPRFSSEHFPSFFYPHERRPGTVVLEGRIPDAVRRALQEKGHQIHLVPDWSEGFVLAVQRDGAQGILLGGADPRGELAGLTPTYAIGW
ncbi:MAG: gamma-glutamyltransferase family protein [Candidatus Tectomicrobia bacterium]|uniref:Gamma-glutamyltransferase family protein n=1 Tax=Tectimicrobiota bacterium TaxID=2528274 RepID=A0A932CMU6_UNCTE|nr:gamma-glutamyltransferase family protein [Candidatus Tectomicrobia bacterium]